MVIYLGLLLPAGSSNLPRGTAGRRFFRPYLVLLQMGFTEPCSHLHAGELLPHLSTLTRHLTEHSICILLQSGYI